MDVENPSAEAYLMPSWTQPGSGQYNYWAHIDTGLAFVLTFRMIKQFVSPDQISHFTRQQLC